MTRNWWETRWFALAAILLSAVPLLWPAIPPLLDVPGHIGRYHIALDLARSADLQRHWSYHWGLIGNLGVDLLVVPLSTVFGVELAAKLVILAIPPLTVAGMIWLSREASERVSPLAPLAFPLAYAWSFQMGFVNFALSAALALLALALWIRLGRQDRLWLRAGLFVPIACALWLAHSFGWGMFGLLAFAAEVFRLRREQAWPRAVVTAALWCVPLSLPSAAMIMGHSDAHALDISWEPGAKLIWLVWLLCERWQWYDIACAVLLYAVILIAAREARFRFDPLMLVLALTGTAIFLALPKLLMGGAYVDTRMLPFAVALALLAIRPPAEWSNALALFATGFFVMRTITTTIALLLFAQPQQRALEAVPHIPRGASVLVLVQLGCAWDWHGDRLDHIAGIAVARRDIFENGQWLLAGQQLLRSRHEQAAPYDRDPSQLVNPARCKTQPTDFAVAIRHFDRRTFDHVWTIGFGPRPALAPDVHTRWSNGLSTIYAVGLEAGRRTRNAAPFAAASPSRSIVPR